MISNGCLHSALSYGSLAEFRAIPILRYEPERRTRASSPNESKQSWFNSTSHRESESKNEDGSRDERDTNFALFHIFDDCSTGGERRGDNGEDESQFECAIAIHVVLKNGAW